jgi:autotransporter-associated beta strand protein
LTFPAIDAFADGTYDVTGGTLAFSGTSPVIKINQTRDITAPNAGLQNTRITSAITGANLTITSDITSTPSVNETGFIHFTGTNTNTGTLTLGTNVTAFFFAGAFNHAGITGVTVNPTNTLDLNFSGTLATPITLNSMGPTNGSTIGILPTHDAIATSNSGGLRLGSGTGGTLDVTSAITFTGDSEIQAAAGTGNIVNLNTNLSSTHHLTLRANQGTQLNVNNPVSAKSVGLRLNQSTASGGGTVTVNAAITAEDMYLATNSNNCQVNINAPVTLTNKLTAVSAGANSGGTRFNATVTAPNGIELARGLTSVELNNPSGFAFNTSEVLLSNRFATSASTLITKANDQISHNAVLHFSGGGNNRAVRLEGHTLTIGGLKTTDVLTATQAVVENQLANTTGVLTVNNAADYEFAGLLRNGTGSNSKLSLVKSGAGTLSLTAANSYTGDTTVSGGSLLVNGAATGMPLVNVTSGGTLGGIGTMNNSRITLKNGSTLSPGPTTGTGILAIGSAVIEGTLKIEYDGFSTDSLTVTGTTGGGDFNADGMVDAADYVYWRNNDNTPANYTLWRTNFGTTNGLNIAGATLNLVNIGTSLQPGTYTIAQYNTLIGSSFAQVVGLPAGFTINYAFNGNQIALVSTTGSGALGGSSSVPEPTSAVLLVITALSCSLRRTRRVTREAA